MMSNIKERDYRFGDYQLAATERVLRRNGEIIPLPLKSLEVLLVLVEQHGRVVSKAELMEQVWPDSHVEEANLARHIYTLRKVLGENSKGTEGGYIQTVPGRGYRFVVQVQTGSHAAEDGGERPIVESHETPAQPRSSLPALNHRALIALVALIALFTTMLLAALIIGRGARVGDPSPVMTFTELTTTFNVHGGSISPDGKYIVMKAEEKGQQSIRVRSTADGNEVGIVPPTPLSLGGLTISPDSNFVYYNATKERKERDHASTLYQVPISGGAVRKIKDGLSGPVSFAPDGIRYAFVREDHARRRSSLLLGSLNDTEEKELIARKTPAEYLDYPAWSPDGSRIVCTLNTETGESRLLEVSLAGAEQLLSTPPSWRRLIRRPIWLKDGSGLVVPVTEGFNLDCAWFLPFPPGGEHAPRRLPIGGRVHRWLSVTDDGRELVFLQKTRIADVWVASLAAPRRVRRVTSSGGHYEGLVWTQGGQLLFASNANNAWNIWVMNADGTDQRPLTFDTYDKFLPSMSPDRRYVFFASSRDGATNIWRINADGSSPKQMTSGGSDVAPQCTPDGRSIIFTSFDSDGAFALRKVPIEGGDPVTLWRGNMEDAVVSPDGRFVACLMAVGPYSRSIMPTRLTVISLVDGSIIRHFEDIGSRPADAGNNRLRWMPDSNGIVYIDRPDGNDNLWMQPLAGGLPRQLTEFSGDGIFGFDISREGQLAILRGPVKHRIIRVINPIIKPGTR
jgi:Tol biopolymer transport system component/DNA-binding winged helix-turn-helix (wHTH) protein